VIGLGLVLYLVNVKGWLSLFLIIMIIPLIGGYMRILTRIMGGININESVKKRIVIMVVVMLGGIVIELRYVTAFIYFFRGVTGAVIIRVYVFVTINVRL